MTKQRQTIQLSLILIGTILILMTYFLYPKISKKDVAKQTDTEIQKKIQIYINFNLENFKSIASTCSPFVNESFHYVLNANKSHP